jgi:hypothetical protein
MGFILEPNPAAHKPVKETFADNAYNRYLQRGRPQIAAILLFTPGAGAWAQDGDLYRDWFANCALGLRSPSAICVN